MASSSVDIKMTFRFRTLPSVAGLSVNSAAQLSACVLFVHERYFNDDARDRFADTQDRWANSRGTAEAVFSLR